MPDIPRDYPLTGDGFDPIDPIESSHSKSSRYLDILTSAERKEHPMYEGLLAYFPDALAMVSHVSWIGNEKHNPGEPLHHARGKSMDHLSCLVRHASTPYDNDTVMLPDGTTRTFPHLAEAAWRALAALQEYLEREYDLPLPDGARDDY